ncbi:hypothetical protein BU16DRAFT_261922 [Lophium mytilinum]|uniref:Uncharacterized protein n=1 Tax=Lophium mytilinum TaxID=390894 RepID=A0A6A6R355_9PEZI|nr:hypothetical protein BU16DRAFT_261922 [Lophium mytilinum]
MRTNAGLGTKRRYLGWSAPMVMSLREISAVDCWTAVWLQTAWPFCRCLTGTGKSRMGVPVVSRLLCHFQGLLLRVMAHLFEDRPGSVRWMTIELLKWRLQTATAFGSRLICRVDLVLGVFRPADRECRQACCSGRSTRTTALI